MQSERPSANADMKNSKDVNNNNNNNNNQRMSKGTRRLGNKRRNGGYSNYNIAKISQNA